MHTIITTGRPAATGPKKRALTLEPTPHQPAAYTLYVAATLWRGAVPGPGDLSDIRLFELAAMSPPTPETPNVVRLRPDQYHGPVITDWLAAQGITPLAVHHVVTVQPREYRTDREWVGTDYRFAPNDGKGAIYFKLRWG